MRLRILDFFFELWVSRLGEAFYINSELELTNPLTSFDDLHTLMEGDRILFPCWRCLFENIRTELSGLGGRNSPHTPLPPASPCLPDRNS